MKGVVQSPTFKVVSLALLGVAVMMAIALALAYTEGASVPKSTKGKCHFNGDASFVVAR